MSEAVAAGGLHISWAPLISFYLPLKKERAIKSFDDTRIKIIPEHVQRIAVKPMFVTDGHELHSELLAIQCIIQACHCIVIIRLSFHTGIGSTRTTDGEISSEQSATCKL
jgi:hypothetical protein